MFTKYFTRIFFVTLAMFAILLLTSVSYADNSTPTVTITVPEIGDVKLEVHNDNGAQVFVLPAGQDYIEGLNDEVLESLRVHDVEVLEEEVNRNENDILIEQFRNGSDSGTLSYARSHTYFEGIQFAEPFIGGWNNVNGSSSGWWNLPGTSATFIILHNELCFNGASLTISWPPSLSGQASCGSYQSQPWHNTNYVSQSYNGAGASSHIWMGSAVQSDSATVRVGTTDYRPSSSVTLPYGLIWP